MIKNSTICKRFFAETPDFFKKAIIIIFIIQSVANLLTLFGLLKDQIAEINAAALAAILIAKFAVKDIALIQNSPDPLKAAIELLPEVLEQKEAVIKTFKSVPDEYPETPVEKPKAA